MTTLRITEIFLSLQGESKTVGLPTVFVRLTGCPLRCQYCDTAYAFKGGTTLPLEGIIERVIDFGVQHVCVTGGEPLAQPAVLTLMRALCERGKQVSLETSGALDISAVEPRVSIVLDIKTPGSAEVSKNLWSNMALLKSKDQVKFVICDQDDYLWSKQIIEQYQLDQRCHVLLSPSHQQLPAEQLADWIITDRLPVRMQLQMHKYLWGNEPGR